MTIKSINKHQSKMQLNIIQCRRNVETKSRHLSALLASPASEHCNRSHQISSIINISNCRSDSMQAITRTLSKRLFNNVLLLLLLGSLQVARAAPPPPPYQQEAGESYPTSESDGESPRGANECGVIMDVSRNYLTPIDVVVKNKDNNVACIIARFRLSIKVEGPLHGPELRSGSLNASQSAADRLILGYLPLENVLKVENTCPDEQISPSSTEQPGELKENTSTQESNDDQPIIEQQPSVTHNPDELEMVVTFECGKLAFTFKRDENKYFMSSIRGQVKLDKKVRREFIANKPMFLTTDLEHRFKYDDLIEIESEAQSKAFILSANFYFTEIEVFRNTASRDFTRPPDEGSKPFSDEKIN